MGWEPDDELDQLARCAVSAAHEVHRSLGPGFLESVYEAAMCVELALRDTSFAKQVPIQVAYKGIPVGSGQLDLLVAGRLVLELKSVDQIAPVHGAQLLSYLRATQAPLGLLINFNVTILRNGIRRIINRP